ncbi:unnamed protein product [marine sediment metagenome]|uniref:Uncharacterized protein n=1 Tax=marine sediment metagenome TaxID=412755 RepID=X0TWD7_9ZZZZ
MEAESNNSTFSLVVPLSTNISPPDAVRGRLTPVEHANHYPLSTIHYPLTTIR